MKLWKRKKKMIQQMSSDMLTGNAKGRFGFHILARFECCDPSVLDNKDFLLNMLYEAADYAHMTPIGDISKKFSPQGATVVLGLEESHISIHTWPEHGTAVIDVYTCGTEISCERAYEKLKDCLNPDIVSNFTKNER